MKTCFIFLFLFLCINGLASDIQTEADLLIAEILLKENEYKALNCTNFAFCSLSPSQREIQAKTYLLLHQCFPERLQAGAHFEFGVYRGYMFWFAQELGRLLCGSDYRYFGFDSFQGLPPASQDYPFQPNWWASQYSCSLEQVTYFLEAFGCDPAVWRLIPGWFSQELFHENMPLYQSYPPVVLIIDSDVYEACVEIMQFFMPLCAAGTILYFDEIIFEDHSEQKAVREYLEQHSGYQFMPLFQQAFGCAFMLTKTPTDQLSLEKKEEVAKIRGSAPDMTLMRSLLPYCEFYD